MSVAFVVSIDTCEVLDYKVHSLFCHERTGNYARKSKYDFDNWCNQHKTHCPIYHTWSADKVKSKGAKSIFLRSLEKRLKYMTFIGDGNTIYGDDYNVIKEECQRHIQKSIGHTLQQLKKRQQSQKLSNGKPSGAKDRITDIIIDKTELLWICYSK